MTLDLETFRALVAEASLAPSVHNIQPTRWRLEPDGRVSALEDASRRLPVGDPDNRDLEVSHGAAVEGFRLAASRRGLAVKVRRARGRVAELELMAGGGPDDLLAEWSLRRRTYRGRFDQGPTARAALKNLLPEDDLALVDDPARIADLAALYDAASLRWFRRPAYRAELLSWMRLDRRHPGWSVDGLNAEAMEMSTAEAVGAGFVLRRGVFETLDRLGLARPLTAEAPVVQTASAIALFHRPMGEAPFETGRRFHRVWLGFTAAGLSACPMAVLADDPEAREEVVQEYGLGRDRRLITAFRLGVAPQRALPPKPRLPLDALIV